MSDCEHEWEEVKELYALTKVEISEGKANFFPSSGIPIVVFLCKKCGQLKLFSAKVKGRF